MIGEREDNAVRVEDADGDSIAETPNGAESPTRRALLQLTIESQAQRAAKKPEPFRMKRIPKLHMGMLKIDKDIAALRLSASARESVERRKAINFDEEDSMYEEMLTDRSVDAVLNRTNRDELSKKLITQLDKIDFRKSVEEKVSMMFAEYQELSSKAQMLCESGETVLDVSFLKLGDRRIESLVDGFSKVSSEASSILHVLVRDNRLSDEGKRMVTIYFNLCQFCSHHIKNYF